MNFAQAFASALTVASLSTLSLSAAAQTVDVKCETSATRSKASVDGSNLARGQYSAQLVSGANSARSVSKPTIGDEVEFDFDSNPQDIRAGATPIAKNFIVNNTATGKLLNSAGRVVAQKTVTCRRK